MGSYEQALDELVSSGIVPCENSDKITKAEGKYSELVDSISEKTGVTYSEEQRKIIESEGSLVILAAAGSGKTTVLTHMLAKRIASGEIEDTEQLICTTYSKAGASEMGERLNKLLKKVGIEKNVKIRTLHSFFLMLINTFGIPCNKVISSQKRLQFIKEACKEAGYTCKDDDLTNIDSLLSFQVNRIMSDAQVLNSYVCNVKELSLEQYKLIRKGYDIRKLNEGYIDYDDMQLYLYKWLCIDTKSDNPEVAKVGNDVRNYCRYMYRYFYIDEAQDMSRIQYEIVKAMVTNPETGKLDREIVAIGDDDQCIYKWRGADPTIILTIGSLLDIKTNVLSTNYRCKNRIVDFAHRSVKFNNSRYNKSMVAEHKGGSVNIDEMSHGDLMTMTNRAIEKIEQWKSEGDNENNIAVLSRNNFHLAILANKLVDKGIYSSIAEEMKLTHSFMYKDIKTLLDSCNDTYKSDVSRTVLWKMCPYLGIGTASSIGNFQSSMGISLANALAYIVKNFSSVEIDADIQFNVPAQSHEKLRYLASRISADNMQIFSTIYNCMTKLDPVMSFKTLLTLYEEGSSFMYKSKDRKRNIAGLANYICELLEDKGYKDTLDFLRTTEQLESGNMAVLGPKVTLSTIHGAKGKEWKNVILFGCDNISMPSLDSIEMLYGEGMDISDLYDYIDEERRLYYVACTRAKEQLEIITSGDQSVFLLESMGMFGQKESTNNDFVLSLVQRAGVYSDNEKQMIRNMAESNKEIKYTVM